MTFRKYIIIAAWIWREWNSPADADAGRDKRASMIIKKNLSCGKPYGGIFCNAAKPTMLERTG